MTMKMTTSQNNSFGRGIGCVVVLAAASCLVLSAMAGIAFQTQNNDTAIYTFGNPVESGEALAPGLRAFMFERGGSASSPTGTPSDAQSTRLPTMPEPSSRRMGSSISRLRFPPTPSVPRSQMRL